MSILAGLYRGGDIFLRDLSKGISVQGGPGGSLSRRFLPRGLCLSLYRDLSLFHRQFGCPTGARRILCTG